MEGWVSTRIGFHVNVDKTEFICFNQRSDVSTLNGRSLKLRDKFIYLRGSLSSIKNNINTRLANVWPAINKLSVIWKSYQSNKIKHSFFSKQQLYQYCCMNALHGRWPSVRRESLMAIAQECCELYWTSPGGSIPQSTRYTDTYQPSRKPSKLDEQDVQDTAGEERAQMRCTPSHKREREVQPSWTYLQLLWTDTGCSMEDLLRVRDDRVEWQERVR